MNDQIIRKIYVGISLRWIADLFFFFGACTAAVLVTGITYLHIDERQDSYKNEYYK